MTNLKVLLLIVFTSFLYFCFGQEFTIEKVDDIIKAEVFRKITYHNGYVIAMGERAIHLLSINEDGTLNKLDELALWGNLCGYLTPTFSSLETIGDNIYIYGRFLGESWDSRLYRISINNESFNLEETLDFYGENSIKKTMAINNHLIIIPNNSNQNLKVYNMDLEIVQEIDLLDFPSKYFCKINEEYLYCWEDGSNSILHVYNVNNDGSFEETGVVNLGENFEGGFPKLVNESTLVMCHQLAYNIFDITDVNNWQLLSTIEFVGDIALWEAGIINEEKLIIPMDDSIISLYDISDLTNPEFLSSYSYVRVYDMDGCTGAGNRFYHVDDGYGIHQFEIAGDQIEYLGVYNDSPTLYNPVLNDELMTVQSVFWDGIQFYDISDLDNIEYICTNFSGSFHREYDIEGNYIATPSTTFPDHESSIDIYDISDVENPILVNKIEDTYAATVYLESPFIYAHVKDLTTSQYYFVKYDISQSFNPELIYSYELDHVHYGFHMYNGYLYTSDVENHITILGNLDGAWPEIVNTVEIPSLSAFFLMNNNALSIWSDDGYDQIFSLDNPIYPDFIFELLHNHDDAHNAINENLFLRGMYTIDFFDVEYYYNPENSLYSLELPYQADGKQFLCRDGEDYLLLSGRTGIALYKYNYDNSDMEFDDINQIGITLSNHPNPFNPTTTISFSLNNEIAENIEIEIYNVKGQKIKSMICHPEPVEGRQTETTYSTTWHGSDQSGNPVSSGIYFYKLNMENSPVGKMVLMK